MGPTGSPQLQEERQSLLRQWLQSQPSAPGAGAPKPGGGALSQQQLEFIVALHTQARERGEERLQGGTDDEEEEEQDLWEDWREAERPELDWRWPVRGNRRGGGGRSASSSPRRRPRGRRDSSTGSALRWRALQEEEEEEKPEPALRWRALQEEEEEEEEEEEPVPCVSRARARRPTPIQKGRGTQGRGGLANGRLPRSSRRPHVIALGGQQTQRQGKGPGGAQGRGRKLSGRRRGQGRGKRDVNPSSGSSRHGLSVGRSPRFGRPTTGAVVPPVANFFRGGPPVNAEGAGAGRPAGPAGPACSG